VRSDERRNAMCQRAEVEAPGIELVQAAPSQQPIPWHFRFKCWKLFRSRLPQDTTPFPSVPPDPAPFVEALWRRRVEFLVPSASAYERRYRPGRH